MDVADLIAELDTHGAALADAAASAGLDTPVPTCPGWDIRALLAHVGMVHRWATGIVRDEPGAAKRSDYPAPDDGVVEWFRAGHAALTAALSSAPPDLELWTFLPAPSPLAFWARRQAHETAIHRADAESAAGTSPAFTEEFAVDGIAELLEGFYGRPRGKLVADPGFVLEVTPDDSAVSWTVAVGPEGRVVSRHVANNGVRVDATLRGNASDLYLDVWNRARPGSTRVEGESRPIETWRELATVSWS